MFSYLLRETQFHGGRRLAYKHFRCCWMIVLVLLFGSAVTVIVVTVARFFSNPTYIVRKETASTSVLFPSVQICPEVQFVDWKIDAFLKNNSLKIPTNLNMSYIKKSIYQLAAFYSADTLFHVQDLMNMELFLDLNGVSVDSATKLFTASCEETLIRCRWQSSLENCSKLFQMKLTGVGYCCVFNGRSLKRPIDRKKDRVYSSSRAGFVSGLVVAVNQSQDPYNLDLTYKWVALQNSETFVEPVINGTPLNPGSELWAEFHAGSFQIDEMARTLDDDLKKCRMTNEHMDYFPNYQRDYCLVECTMHQTLSKCGCVRSTHPLPKGARYCQAEDIPCAAQVKDFRSLCDCPHACDIPSTSIKLSHIQIMQTPGINYFDSLYDGLDFRKVTILRVFLASKTIITSLQWSYYDNLDLFAQLGGVFSLFFGCSVLTLLELVVLAVHGLSQLTRKI